MKLTFFLLCLPFALVLESATFTQERGVPPTAPSLNGPGYPETPEGLKRLIEDVLVAVRAGDDKRTSDLLQGWILPNHREWFSTVLGAEDGTALAQVYETRIPDHVPRLRAFFSEMAQKGWKLEVEKMSQTPGPNEGRVTSALRKSFREPVSFYVADFLNPSNSGTNVGYFVYVAGAFRRIDVGVLSALTALKPKVVFDGVKTVARIRVGGRTMDERILRKVQPRYPAAAARQGIQGTARLEVLVGTEGTVSEVRLLSGEQVLGEAAIEAVRQWLYHPVMLNGRAVEVLTTVDVVFSLNP